MQFVRRFFAVVLPFHPVLTGVNKVRDLPTVPPPAATITVLTVMLSRKDRRIVESVGKAQQWRVLSAPTWTEALAALDAQTVNVLLVDRKSLGSDWRDLLNFFLLPVHRCCVVLTTETIGDRFCEEFLQGGGYEVLKTPLSLSGLPETIQDAWAYWSRCVALAHGSEDFLQGRRVLV